jgi:chromosome condensin MukBEF MukE localization factor
MATTYQAPRAHSPCERKREKMEENAFCLHLAPYFFIFFFLRAFATLCFTSERFQLASLESKRICYFYLEDNRLAQQLGLVNIKRPEK